MASMTIHDLPVNQHPEVAEALAEYEGARVIYSEARARQVTRPMLDEARAAVFAAQAKWLALRDARIAEGEAH